MAAALRRNPDLEAQWFPVVFGEESYQVATVGELWLEALLHASDATDGDHWGKIRQELLREPDDQRLHDAALARLLDFADERGKRLFSAPEASRRETNQTLPLLVRLAAAAPDQTLRLLERLPVECGFEPLAVAVALDLEEEVRAPVEMVEVARDRLDDIRDARRAARQTR